MNQNQKRRLHFWKLTISCDSYSCCWVMFFLYGAPVAGSSSSQHQHLYQPRHASSKKQKVAEEGKSTYFREI